MQRIQFSDGNTDTNSIAILIKGSSFKAPALYEHYVDPLINAGVDRTSIAAYPLWYPTTKVSAKDARSFIAAMLPELVDDGVELLYVADAEYFKQLTGQAKAEVHLGYVMPCAVKGFEQLKVVLGASFASLFHNPGGQFKIDQSLHALSSYVHGKYLPPGNDLFANCTYNFFSLKQIQNLFDDLMLLPAITVDIETLSLKFKDAGICTIAFAKDTSYAYALPVDTHGGLGPFVRSMLKKFFTEYQGTTIWHNAGYDMKVIIYNLWMKHPLDFEGMYEGIEIMTRKFHDTKIIAYLALNSCERQVYSLKVLAQEFAGNYAEADIKNALLIEPEQLLKYNCVDTLATWYVFNKYYPRMIADQQNELYEGLMKDSVALILQIELTGMPINMEKVLFAETELQNIELKHLCTLHGSPLIQAFEGKIQQTAYEVKQASLKKKTVSIIDFLHVKFNPASGVQLQKLLYEELGLPILDRTKKKQPATGGKTLKKLISHTNDPQVIEILNALNELSKVSKILTAFIPTFKNAWLKADGMYYLHGSFNIGGTVSGRLSASDPNLQQIPSGSTYGKLIKDCFSAPKKWIMASADFSALEELINALLTKDPNKLKIFTDGYDSHCFRTKGYWPDLTPDIDYSVASINSMADKSSPYYPLRSKSKAPSFALQFWGTYITLMRNCGFSEAEAKAIESNYHQMYAVSRQWVTDRLKQASIDGYSTAAFGLRVRTPLLKQVVFGSNSVPFEAQAEARTLGNAISGQSYGLLNNRAAAEFMKRVKNSIYKLDIRVIALIHDAIYLLIRDDIDVVTWVNENLVECMAWQKLPEIQHPTVKISSNLDLHHPSWAYAYTLPNHATKEEILAITSKPIK